MREREKLLKNTFWVYLFTYLSAPIGYLLRIIYSRELSIEEFGLFFSMLGFFTLLSLFNDFGFTQTLNYYGTKFYEKKDFLKLKLSFYYAIMMQFITSLIISIIIYFSAKFLEYNYFNFIGSESYIKLMIFYFIFMNVSGPLITLFIVRQDFLKNNLLNFIRQILTLITSMLIFILPFKLETIIYSWIFGYIIVFLIAILLIRKDFKEFKKYKLKFDKKLYFKLLKYAFPVVLSSSAIFFLGGIDIQIITIFKNLTQVALYSNAMSIANILTYLINPITTILFPLTTKLMINKEFDELSKITDIIYKTVIYIGLPVIMIFVSFSKEILRILYQEQFVIGYQILMILVLGMMFSILSGINFSLICGFGEINKRVKILYSVAIFNFIGDLIIINYYGTIGVAIITSLSFFLMFILSFSILKEKIKIQLNKNNFILKIILSNILLYFIVDNTKKILNLNVIIESIIVIGIAVLFYIIFTRIIKIYTIKKIVNMLEIKLIKKIYNKLF